MKIYRMHRSARAAADHTGAMLASGRWNPIPVNPPVIVPELTKRIAGRLSPRICVQLWFYRFGLPPRPSPA
jgi:hypothetical protein